MKNLYIGVAGFYELDESAVYTLRHCWRRILVAADSRQEARERTMEAAKERWPEPQYGHHRVSRVRDIPFDYVVIREAIGE